MGIRGIYNEIGTGRRIALSKLAVETYEKKGRPLRVAIDVSIWLFQIQAGKGGSNPALRTFYYRLLRLISLSIQPLFVFDGPNKPPLKRNKHTGPNVASIPEFLAKALLRHFGLCIHLAPGEAEAECAWLQKKGIVDAVLSEDVDTLMFGSGLTLRNWSPEGGLHTKTPTHVNLYDAETVKAGSSGLDRAGMILVAMMSGGDYLPEGIPGCGPKTACEAARAGFGTQLCDIPLRNKEEIATWKESLVKELHTNSNSSFSRKHKALVIPEDFPRLDVLSYYTHPCVSTDAALDRLAGELDWDGQIDIPSLRQFTADAFDWTFVSGAKKFVRNLAPALLVRELILRADTNDSDTDDTFTIAQREAKLVKHIYSTRQHVSTDSLTELRVGIVALDIVQLDLDEEEPDPEMTCPDEAFDDEELAAVGEGDDGDVPSSQARKRGPYTYDPSVMERIWVFETYLRAGLPLKTQDWDETFRNAKKYESMKAARKQQSKAKSKGSGMPKGALDKFTRVVKPGASQPIDPSSEKVAASQGNGSKNPRSVRPQKRSADEVEPQAFHTPRKNHPTVIDLLSSPCGGDVELSQNINNNERPTDLGTIAEVPRPAEAAGTGSMPVDGLELPNSVTIRRIRSPLRDTALPTLQWDPSVDDQPSTPGLRRSRTAQHKENDQNVIVISSSPTTPGSRQRSITDWASPSHHIRSGSPSRAKSNTKTQLKSIAAAPTSKTQQTSSSASTRVLTEISSPNNNPPALAISATFAGVEILDISETQTTSQNNENSETLRRQSKKVKCVVNLRESFEGAWSLTERQSLGSRSGGTPRKLDSKAKRNWRMSQIETLDLTGR